MSKIGVFLALFPIFISGSCFAASGFIEESPTKWRLQDYITSITVWYTSAAQCTNGHLTLPNVSADLNSRFWSTVMTAKVTGKKIGVTYDASSCTITDYYLKEE
ncbi:hypothetical protein [Nitrospirillum viridazoti]|uniref:hypothetical protein n=1 Tax=Nitrospirillum viridazoti TaxID=3144925 RepID=UPI00110FB0DD|nr:hypothetical protein [Nitrospirillum amazonense]